MIDFGFPQAHQGPTKLLFPRDKLPVKIERQGEFPAAEIEKAGQGSAESHRPNDDYM